MGIPRGRKGIAWYFAQANTYDIGVAIFTAIVGLSSAANYADQGKQAIALLVGLATIGVFVFALIKNGVALVQSVKRDSPHELEGCLHTLHAALDPDAMATMGLLRLAIHVPVADKLEQATEYIGATAKPGRVGRQFPNDAGIMGRAFQENTPYVGQRDSEDPEQYVQELVEVWNYSPQQAQLLNMNVRAWMAVPFYDTDYGRVAAVLYLDSTDREFFTASRQELVLAAVNGIAMFIGKRYP